MKLLEKLKRKKRQVERTSVEVADIERCFVVADHEAFCIGNFKKGVESVNEK